MPGISTLFFSQKLGIYGVNLNGNIENRTYSKPHLSLVEHYQNATCNPQPAFVFCCIFLYPSVPVNATL